METNIRIDLREIDWEGIDWIHLVWNRDQWTDPVKKVMNFSVP
jgi:hypothetical protein